MIKYVVLLFNTVALLIYQFFFADGITVTQKAPLTAKPGTEFTVELTIKKGDVDGFAKLQEDLPDGLVAEEGSSAGASFTFSNQSVKFIWMSLPNDKDFKVSYKVKVDVSTVSGDKFIAGKFSYIVDNVKQQVEIAPVTVKITSTSANTPAVANTTPATTPATPSPTPTIDTAANFITISGKYFDDKGAPIAGIKCNLINAKGETARTIATDNEGLFSFVRVPKDGDFTVKLNADDLTNVGKSSFVEYKDNKGNVIKTKTLSGNVPLATTTPAPSNTNGNEQTGLGVTRNVPENVVDGSIVEIVINKANISGFAKYIETLPAGITATAVETQGASFSFADQKIKYVWVSLPTVISFKVSYKLGISATVSGKQTIDGSFSYIENDETKKYPVAASTVNIAGGAPVAATTEPAKPVEEPVKQEPVVEKKEAPVAKVTTENKLSASTVPSPQGEVNYSVQIAALRNAKAPETLATMFKITEPVKTEMADGFTKYTVGSHKVYKEAHDARDMIKTKGVNDAWVTAYNKGKRITVQEALMITSQKWYK